MSFSPTRTDLAVKLLTLSCHNTKYFGEINEIFPPAPYHKIPFIANISGTALS
jgi:hypothetical protein